MRVAVENNARTKEVLTLQVPGYCGIGGNAVADLHTRDGSNQPCQGPEAYLIRDNIYQTIPNLNQFIEMAMNKKRRNGVGCTGKITPWKSQEGQQPSGWDPHWSVHTNY